MLLKNYSPDMVVIDRTILQIKYNLLCKKQDKTV